MPDMDAARRADRCYGETIRLEVPEPQISWHQTPVYVLDIRKVVPALPVRFVGYRCVQIGIRTQTEYCSRDRFESVVGAEELRRKLVVSLIGLPEIGVACVEHYDPSVVIQIIVFCRRADQ